MPSFVLSAILHSVSYKEEISLEENVPTAYIKRTQGRFKYSEDIIWQSVQRNVARAAA